MKTCQYLSTIVGCGSFICFKYRSGSRSIQPDGQSHRLLPTTAASVILQTPRAYHGLGDALIRKARETGDPSYFNRAEEALKKSLEINPNNAGAMRHLAYVFYSRHEFEAAAVHARKAIEMDSTDGDSYGILGDALMETGEYEKAEDAYEKMMQLEESLYSYSRRAGLKSMRGDSAGAIADLERAIAAGKAAKQPAESIAWARVATRQRSFHSRKTGQTPNRFTASPSRLIPTTIAPWRAWRRCARRRSNMTKRSISTAKPWRSFRCPSISPRWETSTARWERSEEARKQYELVEYIGKLSALNKALYNRELAYFYADHDIKLKEGLELAQRELDYRRDIYAYDVLAWNLYKNGKV